MSAARSKVLAPVVALLVGAALLWASSRVTWLVVIAANDQSGEATRALSGSAWQPVLVPVALGAVAGVAAVALARGGAARVVGVVLCALAAVCVIPVVGSVGEVDRDRAHAAVTESDPAAATNSGSRTGTPTSIPEWSTVTGVATRPVGPGLAGLAALALAAAGLSLLVRPPVAKRADDRFAAPADRRDQAAGTPARGGPAEGADVDTGRGMWDSLDAGGDPTA